MKLFIQIKDGLPFGHPIVEDNFKQAFPEIDINNLPAEFANFERVEMTQITPYEVYEGTTYEFSNGVYKDVHHFRTMTEEEKQEKIANTFKRFPSWVFDEQTCTYNPPIAYPNDNKNYLWDEQSISWVEVV